MRMYLQVLTNDGILRAYGPYDGTSCHAERDHCYWARTLAKAGGVKCCYVVVGGQAIHAYRSKGDHGYQKARRIDTIGASQFARW